MSFVKVWIHAVWCTHKRSPLLTSEVRNKLFAHIRENAKRKEIHIDTIGGHLEHIHCLFSLNTEMSVANTLQLIKGEVAFWANKNGIVKPKLKWAKEYFAISVSESLVPKVRNYIIKQDEHHKKQSFQDEYDIFIKSYRFKIHG